VAWPFEKPVDPKQFPDYGRIVQRPMDLETVEKRVKKGHYMTPLQFKNDLQLIWANCRKYNAGPEGADICAMATRLETGFDKLYEKIEAAVAQVQQQAAIPGAERILPSPEKVQVKMQVERGKEEAAEEADKEAAGIAAGIAANIGPALSRADLLANDSIESFLSSITAAAAAKSDPSKDSAAGNPTSMRSEVLRDSIQNVTERDLLRLMASAGVEYTSQLNFEELRGVLKLHLENLLRHTLQMAKLSSPKGGAGAGAASVNSMPALGAEKASTTVTALHVISALVCEMNLTTCRVDANTDVYSSDANRVSHSRGFHVPQSAVQGGRSGGLALATIGALGYLPSILLHGGVDGAGQSGAVPHKMMDSIRREIDCMRAVIPALASLAGDDDGVFVAACEQLRATPLPSAQAFYCLTEQPEACIVVQALLMHGSPAANASAFLSSLSKICSSGSGGSALGTIAGYLDDGDMRRCVVALGKVATSAFPAQLSLPTLRDTTRGVPPVFVQHARERRGKEIVVSAAEEATAKIEEEAVRARAEAATAAAPPTLTPKEQLVSFYKKHNPEKLDNVDATLAKYAGNERVLFEKLDNKYGTQDFKALPKAEDPVAKWKVEQAEKKKEAAENSMSGTKSTPREAVHQILKQVHPDTRISPRAQYFLVEMAVKLMDKLTIAAMQSRTHRAVVTDAAADSSMADADGENEALHGLTSSDVQSAVQFVFPGELAKHGVSEGVKMLKGYDMLLEKLKPKPPAPPVVEEVPKAIPPGFDMTPFEIKAAIKDSPWGAPSVATVKVCPSDTVKYVRDTLRKLTDKDFTPPVSSWGRSRVNTAIENGEVRVLHSKADDKPVKDEATLYACGIATGATIEIKPKAPTSAAAKIGIKCMYNHLDCKAHMQHLMGGADACAPEVTVGTEAAIFMAAVLEYMTAEVLELAGNAARDNKKETVEPRHIQLAIMNDEELNKVGGACGGTRTRIFAPLVHTLLWAFSRSLRHPVIYTDISCAVLRVFRCSNTWL
jgi:histone H3/H4